MIASETSPVYTIDTECQDCYRCVRGCLVKAITVEKGHARIDASRCIACGHCVENCPAKAKCVRDDSFFVRDLLKTNGNVYASLAPSWVSDFPDVEEANMIAALKKLGFKGVSETALGAQEVSAGVSELINKKGNGIYASTACPSAVDFIRRYLPTHTSLLTPVVSPLLAHCRILKKEFGEDIKIVFFGPCIAKKLEAEQHPELLEAALNFEDLRRWFGAARIDLSSKQDEKENFFVPFKAKEGAIYPIEGGMSETIKAYNASKNVHFVTIAGLENINRELDGVVDAAIDSPVFLELLSCSGGCVNGPCSAQNHSNLFDRMNVVKKFDGNFDDAKNRKASVLLEQNFLPSSQIINEPDIKDLRKALYAIGKRLPEDELNCGACGYHSCRELATALINKKAEPSMCASYMRKQVQKKANALLRCIPSGVVIVASDLSIIECNETFLSMFKNKDDSNEYDNKPLSDFISFSAFFAQCLTSRNDVVRKNIQHNKRLYDLIVFSIEAGQVVGGLVNDVTDAEKKRLQIAKQAGEVINRNLSTVQDIACMLGEHMAETETLLRSIAIDYEEEK